MLLSALFFSFMSAFVKLSGDIPLFEKALFRNSVSLVIAFAALKSKKMSLWGKRENRLLLLLRAFIGAVGIVLYFYSIDHLILADSSMLNKLSPFFVIVFAAIFLKNRIRFFHIAALVIALSGAALIIKPGFHFSSTFPAVIGLLAAVSAGLTYTMVSYLGNKESSYTIVFFFSLISSLVCVPFVLMNPVMPDFKQWIFLLAAGVTAGGGQITLTAAYKYAPAGEISIYQYAQIVFAGILGIFIFTELPDYFSLIGYVLVFSGGYLVYRMGRWGSVVVKK